MDQDPARAFAGLRKKAVASEEQLEFEPSPFLVSACSSALHASGELLCVRELILHPLQCATLAQKLLNAVSKRAFSQYSEPEQEEIASLVLFCTIYSFKSTRKTLLRCLGHFSFAHLGKALVNFLSSNSKAMTAKEVAGITALVDSKPLNLRAVVANALLPWLSFLCEYLRIVATDVLLDDHIIVKAVVSTLNFLQPEITSALQSQDAPFLLNFNSIVAMLATTLVGPGTRDCVLLSALGLCFAVRCVDPVPALLPAMLARHFFPDEFAAAPEVPALPASFPTRLPAHSSPLVRLAVTRALLSCFDCAVLAQPLAHAADGQHTVVACLLQRLVAIVDDQTQASLHFLALQSIALWLRALPVSKAGAPDGPEHKCTQASSAAVVLHALVAPQGALCRQLLELVFGQWEHPVENHRQQIRCIFQSLLEGDTEGSLLTHIAHKLILQTPWHLKGRYELLCSVLQCLARSFSSLPLRSCLLQPRPPLSHPLLQDSQCSGTCLEGGLAGPGLLRAGLPQQLSRCMGLAALHQAAASVYTTWCKASEDVLCADQDAGLALLQALEAVGRGHPRWLHAYVMLLQAIRSSSQTRLLFAPHLPVSQPPPPPSVAARVDSESVSTAKDLNSIEVDVERVRAALLHQDAALAVMALAMATVVERDLFATFISANLNAASPGARQAIVAAAAKLLLRARRPPPDLSASAGLWISDPARWLALLAESSLGPSASYQRMSTSLQLLSVALSNLAPGLTAAEGRRLAASLHPVLLSSHADLRDHAHTILLTSCSLADLLASCGVASVPDLFRCAIELASRAAGRACDPGAGLCRTAFVVACVHNGVGIVWDPAQRCLAAGPPSGPEHLPTLVTSLDALGAVLADQIAAAKVNAVAAAGKQPMHGVAAALAACWTALQGLLTRIDPATAEMLRGAAARAVQVVLDLADLSLGLMGSQATSGAADDDEMPSFCALQESLDSAAARSGTSVGVETTELLLSMAWQGMEQAAGLMVAVLCTLPLPSGAASDIAPVGLLQACVDSLVASLRSCRHQGVIEACAEALARIAKRVLRSTHTHLYAMFYAIARDCISLVEDCSAAFSVTRRSAGLPAIVLAVVTNPTANAILEASISTLLAVAGRPLPQPFDASVDLPQLTVPTLADPTLAPSVLHSMPRVLSCQVHAFNILRVLFHDGQLAAEAGPLAATGMVLAIEGFGSPSWAVRNACTLLFGALVTRMLGCKRVRDDTSRVNSITASQCFTRYPKLQPCFETTLLAPLPESELVHPGWFPVLTLLSKLKPSLAQEVDINLHCLSDAVLRIAVSCRIHHLRQLAAAALPGLLPGAVLLPTASRLVLALKQDTSHNAVHGALLSVQCLAHEAFEQAAQLRLPDAPLAAALQDLLAALGTQAWLAQTGSCPVTRAAYVSVARDCLVECHCYQWAPHYSHLALPLLAVVASQAIGDAYPAPSPGAPDWPVACASAKLVLALRFTQSNASSVLSVVDEVLASPGSGAIVAMAGLLAEGERAVVNEDVTTRCWSFLLSEPPQHRAEAWCAVAGLVRHWSTTVSADAMVRVLMSVSSCHNIRLVESGVALLGMVLPHVLQHREERLNFWLALLGDCSCDDKPSTLREAACLSLRAAMQSQAFVEGLSPSHLIRITTLLLWLLESEEDDLRSLAAEAAEAVGRTVSQGAKSGPRAAMSLCMHVLESLALRSPVLAMETLLALALGSPDGSSCDTVASDSTAAAGQETLFARESPNSYREPLVTSQLAVSSILYLLTGTRSIALPPNALNISSPFVTAVLAQTQPCLDILSLAVRIGSLACARLRACVRRTVEPVGLACQMAFTLAACIAVHNYLDPPTSAYDEPAVFDTISALGVMLEYLSAAASAGLLPPPLHTAAAMVRRATLTNKPAAREVTQQLASLTVALMRAVCLPPAAGPDSPDADAEGEAQAEEVGGEELSVPNFGTMDAQLVFPECFAAFWMPALVPSIDIAVPTSESDA